MKFLFNVLQVLFFVLALQFILIFSHLSFNLRATASYTYYNLDTVVYNLIILYLVYCIFAVITNKKFLSWYLLFVSVFLFSATNYLKIKYRGEPLLPSDLAMYKEAVEISGFLSGFDIAVTLILIIIIILGGVWLVKYKNQKMFKSLKLRLSSMIIVCASMIILFKGMNYENNFMKLAEVFNYQSEFWDMEVHYASNGPLVGFLSIADLIVMDEMDYEEEDIIDFSKEFNWKLGTMENHIVVYILSESFSDPYRIEGLEINKDPIPFVRKMLNENTSGLLYQQTIGGGTSKAEYEALTGFSNSLFHNSIATAYQHPIPDLESHPMVGNIFDKSIAIHAHNADLYRRPEVFNKFGFDKFMYEDSETADLLFKEKIQNHPYISDESAFKEVLQTIKTVQDDENSFIYLATMQNHSPYLTDAFDSLDFKVNSDYTGTVKDEIEAYLQGLNYTDKALKNFISKVEKVNRPVTIVFFGDHYPSFVKNITTTEEMYKTDYFIYHNFENEKLNYPLISPNYLSNVMLKSINFPQSNYFAFLDEMLKEYTVIHPGSLIKSGEEKLQNINEFDGDLELFERYRMLQYDIVVGEQYSIKNGLYDISIE